MSKPRAQVQTTVRLDPALHERLCDRVDDISGTARAFITEAIRVALAPGAGGWSHWPMDPSGKRCETHDLTLRIGDSSTGGLVCPACGWFPETGSNRAWTPITDKTELKDGDHVRFPEGFEVRSSSPFGPAVVRTPWRDETLDYFEGWEVKR